MGPGEVVGVGPGKQYLLLVLPRDASHSAVTNIYGKHVREAAKKVFLVATMGGGSKGLATKKKELF